MTLHPPMKFTRIILAGALLALCGCVSPRAQHGIPKFAQVSPNIYRGGQPDAEGWRWLRELSVYEVVKLNSDAEGSDALAAQFGMVVHRMPISVTQQLLGPTTNEIESAVGCVARATNTTIVFVHCSHGEDRTGLVVAAYRREVEGWTKPNAREEMLRMGFHRNLLGLDWYWHTKVK